MTSEAHVRDVWYAAAWSSELGRAPLGRRLLGRKAVLFRDERGRPRALGARCPHRGADLSEGRLVEGALECPFHGWRWAPDGSCVRVPSQAATAKTPNAKLDSLAIEEQEGIVWIRAGDGARPQLPRCSPRRPGRRVSLPPRLLGAPLVEILENALDTAHNAFIHRRVFGRRVDPIVPRQTVSTDDEEQRVVATDDPESPWRPSGPPITGALGLAARLLGQTTPRRRETAFQLGCSIRIYVEYASGKWDAFYFHLTPADAVHTWVFYETVRTRGANPLFDPLQRSFMTRILDDGERELTLVLRDEPTERRPVSVESDRLGLAARQLYQRCLERQSVPTEQAGASPASDVGELLGRGP